MTTTPLPHTGNDLDLSDYYNYDTTATGGATGPTGGTGSTALGPIVASTTVAPSAASPRNDNNGDRVHAVDLEKAIEYAIVTEVANQVKN